MAAPQQRLGRRAEDAVARWLTSRGWRVLERRWRSEWGELDLVCRDPHGTLVGIEVKLRRSARMGDPADALDRRRAARLRRALADYAVQRQAVATAMRIDLVGLTPSGTAWRLTRWPAIDGW